MLRYIDRVGTKEVIGRRALFLRNMKDLCVPLFHNKRKYTIKGIRIEQIENDQYELWLTVKGQEYNDRKY